MTATDMTFEERALDKLNRVARIRRWPARLEAIRAACGSVASFCRQHSLEETQINNAIAGRRGLTWETILAVEQAMDAVLGAESPAFSGGEGKP